jgi:light-regulated signal transduction histidine kinase (bacteriophytochrome)
MVAMALARQLHSHIERDMFASSIRIEQLAMTSMMSSSCLSEFFAHSYQGVLRELDCCGMMVKATVSSQGSGETLHYGQLAPSTMDGIAKVVGSSATVEDSPEGICCLSCVGPFAQDQGAATSLNDPSGLLVAGASFISTNYFQLVLFRPEWEHSVDWAGKAHIEVDPGKGRETDPHERLNPRTSFQLWKENRQGLSKPWSQGDRSLLRALRLKVHFFCSHMLHVQARMSMRS